MTGGAIQLLHGDCLNILPTLAAESVDSVVTDPPYHLTSIVKRFGSATAAPAKSGVYARSSAGFMGQTWDGGDIAFRPEVWAEVLRVLKPGGHLLAFSGTRTQHRMVCAIEDAGFEIRDQIGWVFGQGFPKSHNLPGGLGTALKPAWEPVCVARKPLSESTVAAQVLKTGTGALNIDGCRVGTDENLNGGAYTPRAQGNAWAETGGMNKAGACAAHDYEQPAGRWPANLCHDGSDEVLEAFARFGEKDGGASATSTRGKGRSILGQGLDSETGQTIGHADTGTAARFYFCAKASKAERAGSKHPTVKPLALMQWLCRLVTPPGGIVLDPFAGSGSTGVAASREGFRAILIEREAEYLADIRRRFTADLGMFGEVA